MQRKLTTGTAIVIAGQLIFHREDDPHVEIETVVPPSYLQARTVAEVSSSSVIARVPGVSATASAGLVRAN